MISLLHPSRGRPDKAQQTAKYWKERTKVDTQHLLSIDLTDPQYMYYKNFADLKICALNASVVEATNRAAKHATGDILVYLSDDFKCPDNWGELILKEFEGVNRPMLLKVDDCLQKFHVPVLTIPIMNRQLYERLGYFFHPEYKSMFCDEHLYWTAHKLKAIKMCPHLKFPHEHPANGKAENDETYRRSAANWDQGKALFKKHKSQGFPV
jgi:hypothetical protein